MEACLNCLSAEARHQEALRVKDERISELESRCQYNKEWVEVAAEKIKVLESRIEKLRAALESYDFGPGTIGYDTLLADDKSKEMSK